jgi:hypothetical protein
MKTKQFPKAALPVALFLWLASWAQFAQAANGPQDASAATGPASTPSTTSEKSKTTAKEKHWSGSLVDVACVAKALGPANASANPSGTIAPSVPHFVEPSEPPAQVGQSPGGAGQSPNPGAGGNVTSPQGQYPTTDTTSPQDQARAAQEARLDNATKQCAATSSTQAFGLVMADGHVMQFDPDGNAKASQALKDTPTEPGKKVKAKVAGAMENDTTVNVASVDIKAKAKRPPTQ